MTLLQIFLFKAYIGLILVKLVIHDFNSDQFLLNRPKWEPMALSTLPKKIDLQIKRARAGQAVAVVTV